MLISFELGSHVILMQNRYIIIICRIMSWWDINKFRNFKILILIRDKTK